MFIYTLVVFFCSFLYGLSAILCKYGLQHNVKLKDYPITRMLLFVIRNKIWVLGVLISFAANIIIVEIQSVIDVSVVYPILNFSYVFTLILGYMVLKENLNKNQLFGILIVVIGTGLIIFVKEPATGGATNTKILLILSLISLIIIGSIIYTVYKNKIENYEIIYAICTGISLSNVETYVKANTNLVINELGYFTVLSLESITYFISLWPFLMLVLFAVVGWVCMQITYSHGNVSVTVPIFAVLQSSLTMTGGFFVFNEAVTLEKFVGILTIITGVSIIILSSIREREVKPV